MQLHEVQISICQIVAEQETKESVNKLLKKKERDWSNISVDMQPGVEMRHHKNVNQDLLNLDQDTNLATFTPSLNLPLKYLISGFFLLLFTGEREFSYYPVDSGKTRAHEVTNHT